KSFRVGPPQEKPPDKEDWVVRLPPPGVSFPLTVTFPQPLDNALLHRLLWLTGPNGAKVPGKVSVTDEERRWILTPDQPWVAGAYKLMLDTSLEDLAGNSFGKPFEVDEFHPIQQDLKGKTIEIPLEIKQPFPGRPK